MPASASENKMQFSVCAVELQALLRAAGAALQRLDAGVQTTR